MMPALRRPSFCAAALLAVATLLLSPGGTAQAKDGEGTVAATGARIAYNSHGYAKVDPARLTRARANDERLLIAMLEPLTVLSPVDGSVKPGAATSWTCSADGRTWTFHLRKSAKWDNGDPVTSEDFLRSWSRGLKMATDRRAERIPPWASLLHYIRGCREVTAGARKTHLFSQIRAALGDEIERHKATGIPGRRLNALLDDLGARLWLRGLPGRSLKLMLKWPDDRAFQAEQVEQVEKTLKEERRAFKKSYQAGLRAFGTSGSGAYAKDAHTLIVETEGQLPFFPALVARGFFAPMHESFKKHRELLFDDPHRFRSNGPFLMAGRGSKPPRGQEDAPVATLVHLKRNPTYDGPNKAHASEIKANTDQWATDPFKRADLAMFNSATSSLNAAHHVFCTWPVLPTTGDPEKPESNSLALYEKHAGFQVRPLPSVLVLRFRCDKAPYDKRETRKALVMAMDRAGLVKEMWPAGKPVSRIVPASVPSGAGVRAPSGSSSEGQKAWKLSGVDPEETWFEISYGEAPGQDEVAETLIMQWKKAYGIEPSKRIESDKLIIKVLQSGGYGMMISAHEGAAADALTFLAPFHSSEPEGGLGWEDEMFDALIEGATDPAAARSAGDTWLKRAGTPKLKGLLAGATSKDGVERFRLACLAAAEQRLMDEYVVIPVAQMQMAELGGKVEGLGTDQAWSTPGFVGSLSGAHLK